MTATSLWAWEGAQGEQGQRGGKRASPAKGTLLKDAGAGAGEDAGAMGRLVRAVRVGHAEEPSEALADVHTRQMRVIQPNTISRCAERAERRLGLAAGRRQTWKENRVLLGLHSCGVWNQPVSFPLNYAVKFTPFGVWVCGCSQWRRDTSQRCLQLPLWSQMSLSCASGDH